MTEAGQINELYVYKPSCLEGVKGEIESRGRVEFEVSSRKRKKCIKNSGSFHYLPKEILYDIFSYIGWNNQAALDYALASRQYYQIAMSHPFMRMGHVLNRLKNSKNYAITQRVCFEGILIPKECTLGSREIEKLQKIDPQGIGFNRLLHSETDLTGLFSVLKELFESLAWYPELTMNHAHTQEVREYAQTVHALFIKLFVATTLDEKALSRFDWQEVPRRAIDYQHALSYRSLLEQKTPPQFDGMESNEAYFQFSLESNGLLLEKGSDAIRDNKELVLKAVKQNGRALQFASDRLRNDEDVVLAAVRNNGFAFQHASLALRADKEIAREASLSHPLAFYYADTTIIDDVDFALDLLKYQKEIFNVLSLSLRADRNFVLRALSVNALVLAYLSDEYRKSHEIVLQAVRRNGLALEYADDELKKDPLIVQTALNQNVLAAEYMDERFERNKKIALLAVSKKGIVLEFFETFQDNEEVVVKAVEQDGMSLEHASDRLRGMFSIAYRAVHQNGLALEHVDSDALVDAEDLGDKKMFIIVEEAVKQNGLALEFAPAELQDNEEIVKLAILQNPEAFKYASESLRRRDDLAAMAALRLQA